MEPTVRQGGDRRVGRLGAGVEPPVQLLAFRDAVAHLLDEPWQLVRRDTHPRDRRERVHHEDTDALVREARDNNMRASLALSSSAAPNGDNSQRLPLVISNADVDVSLLAELSDARRIITQLREENNALQEASTQNINRLEAVSQSALRALIEMQNQLEAIKRDIEDIKRGVS